MRNDGERVELCTSNDFEGMIALVDPKDSWVGRWQRICKPTAFVSSLSHPSQANYTKGIYAARVSGTLPEEIQEELQAQGMTYRPRDQNTED
jgi:transcription elongation factor SPT4